MPDIREQLKNLDTAKVEPEPIVPPDPIEATPTAEMPEENPTPEPEKTNPEKEVEEGKEPVTDELEDLLAKNGLKKTEMWKDLPSLVQSFANQMKHINDKASELGQLRKEVKTLQAKLADKVEPHPVQEKLSPPDPLDENYAEKFEAYINSLKASITAELKKELTPVKEADGEMSEAELAEAEERLSFDRWNRFAIKELDDYPRTMQEMYISQIQTMLEQKMKEQDKGKHRENMDKYFDPDFLVFNRLVPSEKGLATIWKELGEQYSPSKKTVVVQKQDKTVKVEKLPIPQDQSPSTNGADIKNYRERLKKMYGS